MERNVLRWVMKLLKKHINVASARSTVARHEGKLDEHRQHRGEVRGLTELCNFISLVLDGCAEPNEDPIKTNWRVDGYEED